MIKNIINLLKSQNLSIIIKKIISNKTFLILLGLIVIMNFLSGFFLTTRNITNIINQVSIYGIIATGMTLVIIMGGIDLSVGSVLALGGIIAANLVKNYSFPMWEAMGVAIFFGSVLGFVNGIIISKLKIQPFVITLAMMTVARGIAYVYVDGTPVIDLPQEFLILGKRSTNFIPIPSPILVMIIVAIIMWIILHFTKFGRYIYYIGGNENAALYSGIDVVKVKIFVYAIQGALSSLAGIILASRINTAQPQAGLGYELDVIAMVIIGGTSFTGGIGTIPGTIIGMLIIGIINNGLNLMGVSSYYQMIAKGVVIASAVILDVTMSSHKNR